MESLYLVQVYELVLPWGLVMWASRGSEWLESLGGGYKCCSSRIILPYVIWINTALPQYPVMNADT